MAAKRTHAVHDDNGAIDAAREREFAAADARHRARAEAPDTSLVYVDDLPPIEIVGIEARQDLPLRTAVDVAVDVHLAESAERPRLVRTTARFPDGTVRELVTEVGPEEPRDRIALPVLRCSRGGLLELEVVVYGEFGGADQTRASFEVVPSNPLQVYAAPISYGPSNWRGQAVYRSTDDLWVCETRWTFSNGTQQTVRFGPTVRCVASDAGLGQIADFSFSITPFDLPAGRNLTSGIYTTHGSGSAVTQQFRNFEDLTFTYTIDTSVGPKQTSLVFAPASYVGVTANFVGSFTAEERSKVISIIDTWASNVYNDFDCIFRPGTPQLEIPSNHPDWSRFRDIHVEENKSGNCVDSSEANDLRSGWSSPNQYNDRIDLFFVETFSGDACSSSLGGFSPVGGPTSKGGSDSGIVIDVDDLNILGGTWGEQVLGVVIAHEVGHFLGLDHDAAMNNFMNATIGPSSTVIRYDQWAKTRKHSFVRR